MDQGEKNLGVEKRALTSIPDIYTLPCTPNDNPSEVDKLMVANFLQTLAEMALTIAARKQPNNPEDKL